MHHLAFRRGRSFAIAALLALFIPVRAGATPLNLTGGSPDITAFFLNFAFDSNGGVCGAGAEMTLCYSGDAGISSVGLTPDITDFPVPYELVAAVDPLTGLLTAAGGSFSIGSYLTGTVSQFGYAIDGGVAVLEFLIAINGGSLAPQFGSTVGVVGSIFDWGGATFGADPFSVASPDAFTDQFAVPEPATLCLLGLGLFAVSAARLRSRRDSKGRSS